MIELGIDEYTIVLHVTRQSKLLLASNDWSDVAGNMIDIFIDKSGFKAFFGEVNNDVKAPEGYTDAITFGNHSFYLAIAYHEYRMDMGIIVKFSAQALDYYCEATGLKPYEFLHIVQDDTYVVIPSLFCLLFSVVPVRRDALDGVMVEQRSLTINDIYHLWKQLKKGLKDNTFRNYQYSYEKFVEPDFGKTKLTDLKRSDVRAFYIDLIEKHGMKVASVDCIHTMLHQVLELAVDDEYLRYNPSDNALKELKRTHSGDSEKRRALTQAEQNLFEDYLYNNGKYNRWYPIFTVMLWTGMRVGEVTGLRWSDIDLEEGTISVNHTLVFYSKGKQNGGSTFAVNTPKTKAGTRIIPMLPKVKEAFLKEKEFQELWESSVIRWLTVLLILSLLTALAMFRTLVL